MENKRIIKVWCPHCNKQEMFKNELIQHKSERMEIKQQLWKCKDCVYVYTTDWFNKFNTFEDFVLRDGESIDKWKRINKISK